ncbi:hypothetical protein [Haloarcula sp. K1]|uniref:hypothetical protein n=1 Tax=Haloarcula sp. K1 TaxID=1622207 RepID=UPI000A9E3103|nr:hypothetical protein [Haloarcula sp. K1]
MGRWPPGRSPTTDEQVFVERGYAVTVRDHRLAGPVAATERILAWCSGPTPESAYMWSLARAEYERWREEVCSQRFCGA